MATAARGEATDTDTTEKKEKRKGRAELTKRTRK
jgi:hypothetical protein